MMKLKILANLMSPSNFCICCVVLILVLLLAFSVIYLLRMIHESLEDTGL